MIAISARLEVERLDPAGLDQGDDAERLDAAPQGHDAIRIAEAADQPAVDVDLDDVAAVDALLDPVADLADEDRRRATAVGPAAGRRAGCPAVAVRGTGRGTHGRSCGGSPSRVRDAGERSPRHGDIGRDRPARRSLAGDRPTC